MASLKNSENVFTRIKDFFWPKEAQKKAAAKRHYKAIGFFVISTATLMKFGRIIADAIYNQNQLDEMVKSGLS